MAPIGCSSAEKGGHYKMSGESSWRRIACGSLVRPVRPARPAAARLRRAHPWPILARPPARAIRTWILTPLVKMDDKKVERSASCLEVH